MIHMNTLDYPRDSLAVVGLKKGDLNSLVYVKEALLCGGLDGHIRLLDWHDVESGDLTVGIVAPSKPATATPSTNFISCLQRATHSRVKFLDLRLTDELKTGLKGISHVAADPTFQKFAVLRESGVVQISQSTWSRVKQEHKEKVVLKDLSMARRVKTTTSPFTGIGSIQLEEGPFFVVGLPKKLRMAYPFTRLHVSYLFFQTANASGHVILWYAKGGQPTSSLEFPSAVSVLNTVE